MELTNSKTFSQKLVALYIICYAGQSFLSTYLSLYLSQIGLSKSRIGVIIAVSTVFLLVAQPFWGFASDRVKYKNHVLLLLFLASAVLGLFFYLSTQFWFVFLAITLLTVFSNPISPLLDNISLESLEKCGDSRWDYGKIRMGGTIGYCAASLASGFVLHDQYRQIFWIMSATMLLCLLILARLPLVKGYPKSRKKQSFRLVLRNRRLIGTVLFALAFNVGLSYFYSYYPIYYVTIGGNSTLVGILMTVCSLTEIPCLFLARRAFDRFGADRILLFSGLETVLRWVLISAARSPVLVIAFSLLHGPAYIGFTYCMVVMINDSVPQELRATSQSLYALLSVLFSKVLFGYLGGLSSDLFGVNRMLLFFAALIFAATVAYGIWRHAGKAEEVEKEAG